MSAPLPLAALPLDVDSEGNIPPPLPAAYADCTLVVDLDGTLTPSDSLVESALELLKRRPLMLPGMLLSLAGGRARLKAWISERVQLEPAALPWREDFVAWLRAERSRGRRIVLATAADRRVAEAVAHHFDGLFDSVLASDGRANLKGANKLDALRAALGPRFVYAGDSPADLQVWAGAAAAVLVGASPNVAAKVAVPVVARFGGTEGSRLTLWARAIRIHQWVKNVLIFVPVLTAFAFNASAIGHSLLAFLAFSLTASATYIGNDLWDLASDRAHRRKRHRPFASGALLGHHGVAVAGVLMAGGVAIGAAVSPAFLAMLVGYVVITTAYSWSLKRYVILDAMTLALLYTWRVVAGAVAIGVTMSTWLLAFSMFLFVSLALIKRCAELVALQQEGRSETRGRNYGVQDLVVLWPLGVGAGLAAVVVFGLFIGAPETAFRFANPTWLWGTALALMYWLSRLWVKTARGVMHDDPIVFALRDRGSRTTVMLMVAIALAAMLLRI